MIVVTGGAGFIGSNLVLKLNQKGFSNILVVDDLQDGKKFSNLVEADITDYQDKDAFRKAIASNAAWLKDIEVIFHQGACSVTTEWNGRYMMEENFETSKQLLGFTEEKSIPYIYASSAAVYGGGQVFKEDRKYESPLNVYGYSKFLFDQVVRRNLPSRKAQVIGMRYFNVYGPRETHKGSMASVMFHFHNQIQKEGELRLFKGHDGFKDGEQRRDFVFVEDVVDVNIWCWQNKAPSGIYNVGTGKSQTFNDVANAVIAWNKKGHIQYVPFPEHLKGAYQSFTEADISSLRKAGYTKPFKTVEEGTVAYLDWLTTHV